MKTRNIVFLLSTLLVACSSGFIIPDPVPGGVSGGGQVDEGNSSGEEPEEPGPGAQTFSLSADGDDEHTYDLILSRGFNMEPPDNSGAHALEPFRHIRQRYDDVLGKYVFDFYLHIQNDDDRGLANVKDRQRNEIKTDGHSPAEFVAQEGETLRMTWLFRLPEGMQTTGRFSHIHQLKGIDNKEGTADVSLPAITFTCRTLSNGKQQLQVIYTAPSKAGSGSTYLARVDLSDFLGEWVAVSETVTFAAEGSYKVVVNRVRDGKQLLKVDGTTLDLWRDGSTGMRPKWGLYRNFGDNRSIASELRDEILGFADFNIEKLQD